MQIVGYRAPRVVHFMTGPCKTYGPSVLWTSEIEPYPYNIKVKRLSEERSYDAFAVHGKEAAIHLISLCYCALWAVNDNSLLLRLLLKIIV